MNEIESFSDEDQEEIFEHFNIVADVGQTVIRIDKFLFDRLPNASRNKIAIAARNGSVLVNGQAVKPNYKIKPKDEVSIVFPHPKRELELIPEDIALNVVFEDDVPVLNRDNQPIPTLELKGRISATILKNYSPRYLVEESL